MNLLPIDQILPELLGALQTAPNAVLHAPPGAGKTTRIPLALLDLFPPSTGRIIMLEPRRLAAVTAARWMSKTLGEEVGGTVGYTIRFERCVSRSTRIEVVTEGILTRRIQDDPALEGVGLVIFDEFHERSLQADLALALSLDVQANLRDDLKLLVMSATLDCGPVAKLLGNAPVISSPGRLFPVREVYPELEQRGPLPARMSTAILRVLGETEGDILAFLPGSGEIRSCAARLNEAGIAGRGLTVCQLFGDLPFEEQQRAILPGAVRKVVLATNIAETSLTIEGVRVVIDSGLSRRLRHDRASGMNRLVTLRESRSSAEQRKGRAGRLGPGVCYRLFSRHTLNAMTQFSPPEIGESDLSSLVLDLATWGVREPSALSWIDPPPPAALEAARTQLFDLKALDENGSITHLGRQMARLPLHPRMASLLMRSVALCRPRLGCDLAAILSERDLLTRTHGVVQPLAGDSDLLDRLDILAAWRARRPLPAGADQAAARNADRVAGQLLQLLGTSTINEHQGEDYGDMTATLLLSAYPDRVAKRRDGDGERYLLANGRGAQLSPRSTVRNHALIVAVSVDAGEAGDGTIHLASALTEDVLRRELAGVLETRRSVLWNSREGRVLATAEERLGSVVLSSRPFVADDRESAPVILAAVRESALGLLNLSGRVRQYQGRVALVRGCFPDDGWPDLSDGALLATLETWLAPLLKSVRSSQQLAQLDLLPALASLLDWRQRTALDRLAPTQLLVPSGHGVELDYSSGDIPVLAVKLQELFGLADTPTVAGGRTRVLLHLLSPARRPIQVTQDLKGFWDGSYHQVKKEMKGRYPKHPWPDDPWNATPTRRAKPKGT